MSVALPLPRLLLAAALTVSLGSSTLAQSVDPSLTLQTKHLGGSEVAWRFLIVTDTGEHQFGSLHVTTTITEHEGKPALLSGVPLS
jgi:hypothetical protein